MSSVTPSRVSPSDLGDGQRAPREWTLEGVTLDIERHALQGPFPTGTLPVAEVGRGDRRNTLRGRLVPEPDVAELNPPADLLRNEGQRVRRVGDVVIHVQVLEDPIE